MDDVVSLRSRAPFVGRIAELERLRQLTAAAASGSAGAVLISGDAGVGKTSLITEAAGRAAEKGLLVLSGRCVDLGTAALPYLPFAEALSQLLRAGEANGPAGPGDERTSGDDETAPMRAAARIFRQISVELPGLAWITGRGGPADRSSGDTGLDRLALFEAVAHLLGRIGAEVAPVLLVLEDLHWADTSTRDLVRFLLARLGSDRMLVLASYRGDDLHRRHPLRPLLGELLRLPQVQRMELLPFGTAELGEFLTGVHGARLPADTVARIGVRSGGNAYYAEELLASGTDDRLPSALADVLIDRLERLSQAGQQLVRMASVLGSARIEDGLLRGAVRDLADGSAPAGPAPAGEGDPGMGIEHAVREALAHQLLVPDGPDRYAFRHALLQEAVYADLLPGERVRRHAAVAHRLAAVITQDSPEPSPAAELARHALAAHDLPQALAASLRAAAQAGRDCAPAEQLAHYEQALQLWDAVPPERRPAGRGLIEIGIAAAGAAAAAGQRDRALHLAQGALAEARTRSDAADRATDSATDSAANRATNRATDSSTDGATNRAAEVAQAWAAVALHLIGVDRPIEAREEARQVIAELAGTGPSPARVLARSIETRVNTSFGAAQEALDVLPDALAEAEALDLPGLAAELLTTWGVAAGQVGLPDAGKHWDAARSAARRAGDQAAMVRVLYNAAVDRIDVGDLAGAIEVLGQALRVADENGLAYSSFGVSSRSLLITVRWALGDAAGALAVVHHDAGAAGGELPAGLVRRLRLFELSVLAARDPEHVIDGGPWLTAGDGPWHTQILQTARSEALTWLGRPDEAADAARKSLDALALDPEPYPLIGISISTGAVAALADKAASARERSDRDAERAALDRAAEFVTDGRDRGRLGRPRRFTMGPEGIAWLARLEQEAARLTGQDDADGWAGVQTGFEGISVYEQARAGWHRAAALIRSGEREPARTELARARESALRLGAAPLLRALDELGRRARIEPARTVDGDLLTPREREVMALVAAGMTNRAIGERLFISEKTASVHVSNVLAKLGASGRTEAVAIIGRRGLLP